MSRDDIIKLAREAELPRVVIGGYDDELERFATLVAAAEREACARIFEEPWRDFRSASECAAAIRARAE